MEGEGWLCNILKALRPKEVGKMCTERSFGSTAGLRRIQIPHSDKNDRNTTQIHYSNQKDTITLQIQTDTTFHHYKYIPYSDIIGLLLEKKTILHFLKIQQLRIKYKHIFDEVVSKII